MTVPGKQASLHPAGIPGGPAREGAVTWVSRVAGVLLIAAGALGLAYGEFSYTRKAHEARIAGIELSLKERETIEVPAWAAGASIAAGTLLLLLGRRK